VQNFVLHVSTYICKYLHLIGAVSSAYVHVCSVHSSNMHPDTCTYALLKAVHTCIMLHVCDCVLLLNTFRCVRAYRYVFQCNIHSSYSAARYSLLLVCCLFAVLSLHVHRTVASRSKSQRGRCTFVARTEHAHAQAGRQFHSDQVLSRQKQPCCRPPNLWHFWLCHLGS
jgi:hypothetical protein